MGPAIEASARVLVAFDGSGSTSGSFKYHGRTQEIVAQFADAAVLHWHSDAALISLPELAAINARRAGMGGTQPSLIAQHVVETDFRDHLVIITDGEVDQSEVDECGRILGSEYVFASVTTHLIGSRASMNLSVPCPFTRASPHTVVLHDTSADGAVPTEVLSAVSADDLAILARVEEVASREEFEAMAEALERAVVARTLGSHGDARLRDALLGMRKRILSTEAATAARKSATVSLLEALDAGRVEEAVEAARAVHEEYYGDDHRRDWTARVARLVSMCEGALRGVFHLDRIDEAVRSDRVRRAATIEAAEAPEAAAAGGEDEDTGFVCPITLTPERDLILLLAEGAPILARVDSATASKILDCPLNLFRFPEVVTALVERLDHPISLAAYQAARASGAPLATSPMTRRTLAEGGVCLGNSEDHCRATAWALARLTTGRSLVGNADLWLAALWLLIVRDARLAFLRDLLPHLEAHCRWRLRAHKTFLSLSGLPEFPTTRVPVGVAVWYVLASSRFTATDPHRELLRAHLLHHEELLAILRGLTDFALPDGVERHAERVRALLALLALAKRDRDQLVDALWGITQESVPIHSSAVRDEVRAREAVPRLIPLDGSPSAERVEAVRRLLPGCCAPLSVGELRVLGDAADPNASAASLALPFAWDAPPIESVVEWAYGTGPQPELRCRICPRTCRPYYTTGPDRSWVSDAEGLYRLPRAELISVRRVLGDFVVKFGFYPTGTELLVFLYNRYVAQPHARHTTLPRAILQFVTEALADYAEVMATLPPAEFVRRLMESRSVARRLELERSEAAGEAVGEAGEAA